jgi:hypothetical protein
MAAIYCYLNITMEYTSQFSIIFKVIQFHQLGFAYLCCDIIPQSLHNISVHVMGWELVFVYRHS